MVDQEVIDLQSDDGISFEYAASVPEQKTAGNTRRRQWLDIFAAVGTAWAVSDEDSPLSTGILFVTEVKEEAGLIRLLKITLKNAPTGSSITVDVEKETGFNTNVFQTILSAPLIITVNNFSSGISLISDKPWEVGKRLRFKLVDNDSNFAASGLKVRAS